MYILSVTGPQKMVVKSYGNRIVLPKGRWGKKVVVSMFDVNGRLLDRLSAGRSGVISRPNAAEGIVIAKVMVVR